MWVSFADHIGVKIVARLLELLLYRSLLEKMIATIHKKVRQEEEICRKKGHTCGKNSNLARHHTGVPKGEWKEKEVV